MSLSTLKFYSCITVILAIFQLRQYYAVVGPAFIYAGVTPGFEKPGITPGFFLIVLKGFRMVSHYGIDNGSPLDVVIIPNYEGNDSAVSYSHMRT